MIFSQPIPFAEALKSRQAKHNLPTTMGSRELEQLPVDIRENSMFSARVWRDDVLSRMSDNIERILNPEVFIPEFSPTVQGRDQATARLDLKDMLKGIGYSPDPEDAGTIKDLSSDARLNLVLETNVQMAQSYGYWAQGQDEAVLDEFPCSELFRAEERNEKRQWYETWRAAGGRIFAGTPPGLPIIDGAFQGRMIARKDDPIWVAISRFGQPYPPFDFNSGMDVMDVGRDEAIALGVINPEEVVQPQERSFTRTS